MQTLVIINLLLSMITFIISFPKMIKRYGKKLNIIKYGTISFTAVSLIVSLIELDKVGKTGVSPVILYLIIIGEMISIMVSNEESNSKSADEPHYTTMAKPKYYITGDKHRNFKDVKAFCRKNRTSRNDVLIILGDTGFNYYENEKDEKLKRKISRLNITLFCLHGNKEKRPETVGSYGIRSFCDGKVYYEPKYPNLLFAIDGEIYNFEGNKYIVVGGAHSVDKLRCLEKNKPFWDDEMPSDETKAKVEATLQGENSSIYGFLTHTCPIEYLPTEMFLTTKQKLAAKKNPRRFKNKKRFQPDIDRSTEEWLSSLAKKVDYTVWFCGHYHADKHIDKVYMMCNEIRPLHLQVENN